MLRKQLLGSGVSFTKKDSKTPSPLLRFFKFDHGRCAGTGVGSWTKSQCMVLAFSTFSFEWILPGIMCGLTAFSLDRLKGCAVGTHFNRKFKVESPGESSLISDYALIALIVGRSHFNRVLEVEILRNVSRITEYALTTISTEA